MKKAQVQFMETIFVLLTLVIIIFIGIVIFFSFFSSTLSEKEQGFTQIDAVTLTDSIIGMPEFTCGPIAESFCIDTTKVLIFNDMLNNREKYPNFDRNYYNSIFEDKRITLNITFPDTGSSGLCTISHLNQDDYPIGTRGRCGNFIIYQPLRHSESEFSQIFENAVPIYFPLIDKKVMGTLKIEVFQQK